MSSWWDLSSDDAWQSNWSPVVEDSRLVSWLAQAAGSRSRLSQLAVGGRAKEAARRKSVLPERGC
eukprot:9215799-Prorocentrum_lima.AAC.1